MVGHRAISARCRKLDPNSRVISAVGEPRSEQVRRSFVRESFTRLRRLSELANSGLSHMSGARLHADRALAAVRDLARGRHSLELRPAWCPSGGGSVLPCSSLFSRTASMSTPSAWAQ